MAIYTTEAVLFGRYLLNKVPDTQSIMLYSSALITLHVRPNHKEKKLLQIILRYPFLLRSIDSGLVILNPSSIIRKKIFILLAVLEASPLYYTHFLPKQYTIFDRINIMFIFIRASLHACIGVILLKLLCLQ